MTSDQREGAAVSTERVTRTLASFKDEAQRSNRANPVMFEIPTELALALIAVAEAAQDVVIETLMCPAGHLDALEVALAALPAVLRESETSE